ncbi:MAG: pseudouridine synthase [Dysosmobacter sp.]
MSEWVPWRNVTQKWIARRGISSRRAAEELLRQGRVTLNGRVAGLGESGDPERDILLVDGRPVAAAPEPVYLMLNKPRGYVTTLSDERGRKTAAELVADCGRRVFPVGRLDKDLRGPLLFTNDGALAQQLLAPPASGGQSLSGDGIRRSGGGRGTALPDADAGGEPIQPAQVRRLSQKGETAVLEVIIHQGKNRQIRRMCRQAGLSVLRLRRVQEHTLHLGNLPSGKWRYLTDEELQDLKGSDGVE